MVEKDQLPEGLRPGSESLSPVTEKIDSFLYVDINFSKSVITISFKKK
jgi:hypothetical protein